LLALVVAIAGVILGISAYAASSLTQFERVPIQKTPSDYGLEYSDISFFSRDGLLLRGWWLGTSMDSPVIVLVHGSERNRSEPAEKMLGIAKELVSHDYNVLMFDMRAHGESEGEHISAGYYERNDLLGAIDYIRQRGTESKIGVLGFSMGAATSLMATAECEEINAVVADSAYADIVSIIESEFSRRSGLPKFFIPIILFMTKNVYDVDFTAVKPVEAVKEITVPVFIIHGGKDDMIPVQHAYKLREACQNLESQLWIVPEASHSEPYLARPAEYMNRLISFFETAFK
jgi:dipeptidyl aminopeptidase/acylaminoacyl peptidase